jgi:hypothetical protein
MNTVVLRRRLIYICAMVVLLIPLYVLGNPSVRNRDGSIVSKGGTLSQLRTKYDLGQSDLGELDPASESVQLATLGQRGPAIAVLWQYAEYYKKEKLWDNLSATLNQIAVLQPHFVKVWEFQSHNLAYNVSVEFDDYRQRYAWVKRGMNYLIDGSKYNKKRTEMPYELGWVFGNKFGKSDEKLQFRKLLREDDNFHDELLARTAMDVRQNEAEGPDGKPDNWRVGVMWYNRAYDMVEAGSRPARSAMMFYRMGPSWDMNYAEGIQAEGILDQAARVAWERGEKSWNEFGQRQISTTWGDTIFLNELELANKEHARLQQDFEEYCQPVFDEMINERKAQLTPEHLVAYEKHELERSFTDLMLAGEASRILKIDPAEIAKQVAPEKQLKAIEKANLVSQAQTRIEHIDSYRNQINFGYWEARCVAEQEQDAITARTSMYKANELLDKGELESALEQYEIAWTSWFALFNHYPSMMIDDSADYVLEGIDRYRRLLEGPDLPEDFALANFMEFRQRYEDHLADPSMMSVISAWPSKYPGRNFLEEMLSKPLPTPEELKAMSPAEEGQDPTETTAAVVDAATNEPPVSETPTDTPPTEPGPSEPANAEPVIEKANVPEDGQPPAPKPLKSPKVAADSVGDGEATKANLPEEGSPPGPKN